MKTSRSTLENLGTEPVCKIAFIGLGSIGGTSAVNLVEKMHTITGFDLSEAALIALQSAGL